MYSFYIIGVYLAIFGTDDSPLCAPEKNTVMNSPPKVHDDDVWCCSSRAAYDTCVAVGGWFPTLSVVGIVHDNMDDLAADAQ